MPHNVPTPTAAERLQRLCAELHTLAESGDLGYHAEHRLRELVDQAQPGQAAESDAALQATLGTYARLVADVEAAADQYRRAVPIAHLQLILQRFRERLPEPRVVAPYDASPLMDQVVQALRLLGCTDRQHGLAVLMTAPAHLTEREEKYVLDQIGSHPHAHQPAGSAVAEPGQQHPCQMCGVLLEWVRHLDRDQYGWRVVTR